MRIDPVKTIRKRPSVSLAVCVILFAALFPDAACSPPAGKSAYPASRHDLVFKSLAGTWDEGIPLGNGLIGALIWKKGDSLRMSLDRADLWDLRPVAEFSGPEFRFAWVRKQVSKIEAELRPGDKPILHLSG